MNLLFRELGQLILDVAICLVLFVLACFFAGTMQHFILPKPKWLYIVWFSIGMLPIFFYARHRGVVTFDNWDIVAFSPFPAIAVGIHALFPNQFSSMITALFAVYVGAYIREFLPGRNGG